MTTHFELAPAFAPAFPLSMISTAPATLRKFRPAPRPAAQSVVRYELVASIRRRIANGTYRVSAAAVAESMIGHMNA